MKPTEHNEMENKALKEHLASAALQMLAEGTDYVNPVSYTHLRQMLSQLSYTPIFCASLRAFFVSRSRRH